MNDASGSRPVPLWYWLVAGFALLFEAFGCFNYFAYVSMAPEAVVTLPLDQQAVMNATPWWMTAAYAIAVWLGLAASLLLFVRRQHAQLLFLVSLIAFVSHFGSILIVPSLRNLTPADTYGPYFVETLIAYGLWHFARLARKRGWLR